MGHHHHRCHKGTKCKAKFFQDGNEKIILLGRHGSNKRAFCDQVVAYPLTKRICR